LPHDCTPDISARGLVWLFRSGITTEEIEAYRICYSPSLNRVILPVYDRSGALIYWQGRYLGDAKADGERKYTNQWQASRELTYFMTETHRLDRTIVLVEDILSAIKVGRVTNSVALLFATIPSRLVRLLVEDGYRRIVLWLDPDKAEYTARQLMRLRSFNYPVRRVYSPRDPKCYSDWEIREFLKIKEESNE
jgi:DNA primase